MSNGLDAQDLAAVALLFGALRFAQKGLPRVAGGFGTRLYEDVHVDRILGVYALAGEEVPGGVALSQRGAGRFPRGRGQGLQG